MAKDCKECKYFNGYDYSDGTPRCDCDGGYECCPFNSDADIKKKGLSIEIDSGFMTDYIRHTLMNTISNESVAIAKAEVKGLITEKLKQTVISIMEQDVKSIIDEEVQQYLSGEITIGGEWFEDERKVNRRQYLAELFQKEMDKRLKDKNSIKDEVERTARDAIDAFSRKLRNDINSKIKDVFSDATRQTLTESVVNMLMCNDTYKKLSDSMNSFLPAKN